MSKLQEKPSALKREHPELQKIKFINFLLFLWVIFALLDPDPQHCCAVRYILSLQIYHGAIKQRGYKVLRKFL